MSVEAALQTGVLIVSQMARAEGRKGRSGEAVSALCEPQSLLLAHASVRFPSLEREHSSRTLLSLKLKPAGIGTLDSSRQC